MGTYKIYCSQHYYLPYHVSKNAANTNSKQHLLQGIEIKKSSEYSFYDNIRDVSVRSFRNHSNDTKRNPWVMFDHIAQLMRLRL